MARMNTKVVGIPDHLERALGPISKGWSDRASEGGIQVVAFENSPIDGVTTYSTLGLNRHLLRQPSGVAIRQELLTSVERGVTADDAARMLLEIAEVIAERQSAASRGELISLGRGISEGASSGTFLCTAPSPFDRTSLVETKFFDPPLIFVYLVALLDAEADLVRSRGWQWFEEQLEAQDPNIWDLARTKGVEVT